MREAYDDVNDVAIGGLPYLGGSVTCILRCQAKDQPAESAAKHEDVIRPANAVTSEFEIKI